MLKSTSKFKFLFLLILVITLISNFSFATDTISVEDTAIPISEGTDESTNIDNVLEDDFWINNDLYIADETVEVSKIVDGNAFIIGSNVTISGEIGGDAFVIADKLTIDSAYIYSNLFVIANEVVVNGTIYDIYAIANNFTLKDNGIICRDLKVTANELNINGTINRNVYATASTYNFSSKNSTLIGGNLEYSAPSEVTIPEGIVTGEIKYNKENIQEESVASKVLSYIYNAINSLVFAFVVILLSIWLAPKFTNRVTTMNTKKACVCLGIGILASIITIIAILLLLFSSIGSMFALASSFMFVAICMASTAFASIYFGGLLAKTFKWNDKVKFVLATLLAALIIWAISKIPYIGNLFGLLVAFFGIGILIVNIIDKKDTNVILETEKTKE